MIVIGRNEDSCIAGHSRYTCDSRGTRHGPLCASPCSKSAQTSISVQIIYDQLQEHAQYLVSEELSMPERKLIPDESLGGYMCNTCGWAWPTQSSVPPRSSPEQALQDNFNAHDCSTHPLPLLKN